MNQKEKYNHQVVESKWQKRWKEDNTYKVSLDPSKPKFYVLDMFPYPSGAGLHVGHVAGYTATDIIARHKRQLGFNVLHPMGWDSFGLPAEQYAVRTGTHPAETTKKNINTYRRQLHSLGFSYDWDREIATSHLSYYKWTQWIFTKLFEKGLAYEADILVNYCPDLGTVLANEEVENGLSKEGAYPVERRPLKQWVLKITAYADRLIEDLDLLDWPVGLKKLQKNWIGRSEGAMVDFKEVQTGFKISVFTTRPDTLFGATYMVLAPEHELLGRIVPSEYKGIVDTYCKETASKSDMERTDLAKTKSGVFTGAYAKNSVNGEKIPIWIADYVLAGYGTGAIMAVPAHDDRDFAFAKKFNLKIAPVVKPDLKNHQLEIPKGMAASELEAKILAGEYCWPHGGELINSSNEALTLDGLAKAVSIKKMITYLESKGFGKASTHYKLRDWLFSRQRYWGEPFPILHFEDGTKRALDLDELPLVPPVVEDYKPAGDGRSPLAKVRQWVEITDPKTGKKALRETNTMPQWAGSCWYYLRFVDPRNKDAAWGESEEKYWLPVDLYVGGVEHAVLHLLYARFWHKVLYDIGEVHSKEPFMRLRNQGLVTARSYRRKGGGYVAPEDTEEKNDQYFLKETGEELISQIDKMSKSKLNGVTPDAIVEEMGADALRLYETFMGPLEKEKVWNSEAVHGCRRFLQRFYDIVMSNKVVEVESEEALKLGNRLVEGVGKDIDALLLNTAIAKMMEFVNTFIRLDAYPKSVLRMAVQCLAPFAPHLAEEMWSHLGGKSSVTAEAFPKINKKFLEDTVVTYIFQVNGKLRGRLEIPKDSLEEDVIKLAKENENVSKFLNGEIKKVIFVPNKLLNFVV